MLLSFPRNIFAGTSQPELEVPAQISRCASGAGGRTCQRYRLVGQPICRVLEGNLARRASAANATTESGGEAETRERGGLRDGRERRSLRSPSERLIAQRRVEIVASFRSA